VRTAVPELAIHTADPNPNSNPVSKSKILTLNYCEGVNSIDNGKQ